MWGCTAGACESFWLCSIKTTKRGNWAILGTDRDNFSLKDPSSAGARTCTCTTPSLPSQHGGGPSNVLGQAKRSRWIAGPASLAATSTSRASSAHWVPLRGAARCSRLRTTWPVRPRISPRGMCICASCEASSLRIACAATTCLKSILRTSMVPQVCLDTMRYRYLTVSSTGRCFSVPGLKTIFFS